MLILLKSTINKNIKFIKIISVIIATVVVVAIIIYMKYFYTPGHGIACFTYKYLGIYCMGCGNTRQLYYALDGQLIKAFSYNVAAIVTYPTFVYLYYLLIRWAIKDKKVNYKQAYLLAAVAILLTIYMIFRNIPLEVFNVLRPPA